MKYDHKPVLIRGWDFAEEDYRRAWQDGTLLTAQIETSNICDLKCEYCFRHDTGSAKRRLPDEISLEETCGVVDQVVGLGARTINIVGAGEPTLDTDFPGLLRHIAQKGVIPVVFTHGANIDDAWIELFDETSASVIVKLNSFNPALQDALVGRTGYTAKRDAGLQLLLDAGYNDHHRLGIDSVVCRANYDKILDIHKWCRNHDVMPLIKTFIPAGRTAHRTDMEVTREEFLALSEQAREFDRLLGIEYTRLLPYLGGVPCAQHGKASVYVTVTGDIFECPGQQWYYGNIEDTPLALALERIRATQDNPSLGCPPRESYWKRFK